MGIIKNIIMTDESEGFGIAKVLKPIVNERESPILDTDEVDARNYEVDQLTIGYILDLMGLEGADAIDIGLDAETLESIEDSFEEVLSEHGITIYRPIILEDENGSEYIASSAYADS